MMRRVLRRRSPPRCLRSVLGCLSRYQARVAAAVVAERLAFARVAGNDLTNEDGVIAAIVRGVNAAIDPGERAVENGRARLLRMPCESGERGGNLTAGEATCRALVILGEDVDGEILCGGDGTVCVGDAFDAGEDERRLEGDGCNSIGGEPAWLAIRSHCRDDGDTGGPVSEDATKFCGFDGHA